MFLSRFKKFVLGLMALATIGLASSQAVAQTSRSDYLATCCASRSSSPRI